MATIAATSLASHIFKTQPRQVQAADVALACDKPAWGRFWEMRVGKGVATVYEMDVLAQTSGATRFLIVCPKRVISTWLQFLSDHAWTPWRIVQCPSDLTHDRQPTVLVINYDRLWERTGQRIQADHRIVRWMPDMVIMDEAQKIKNRTTNRSKAACELGRIAKYRRVLTGTPDPNNYSDYFGIFKFLDPSIFGTWTAFASRYLILDWYRQVRGYQQGNLGELAQKIHSVSSRVLRSECWDVPATEEQTIDVEIPSKARAIYDRMSAMMFAELEEGHVSTASIVLTKLLRLSQITGGHIKQEDDEEVWLHDAKVDALMDVLEEVLADAGAKAVVYFRFRTEIARVGQRLRSVHIQFRELHGDSRDESTILRQFRDHSDVRVLLCQIASGSLGIDLSAAETAIFYSWDFDAASYYQARDRIWKPDGKLTYIHLVVPESIDQTMLDVVQHKLDRSYLILDHWQDIVRGTHAD